MKKSRIPTKDNHTPGYSHNAPYHRNEISPCHHVEIAPLSNEVDGVVHRMDSRDTRKQDNMNK